MPASISSSYAARPAVRTNSLSICEPGTRMRMSTPRSAASTSASANAGRGTKSANHGAAQADVCVAPVVRVLGVAGPLLGDTDAAGEPDLPVHDQELAVGAVLEPLDRVGLRRPEEAHLNAGLAHLLDQLAIHLGRADRVEDHVALYAGARLVAERLRHLDRDFAAPVGVREHVHGLLGVLDRAEVRREDPVAVDQELHVVPERHGRACERLRRSEERLVAHVNLASQRVPVTALAPVAQAVGGVPRRARGPDACRPGVARDTALAPAEPPCSHRRQASWAWAVAATPPRSARRARPPRGAPGQARRTPRPSGPATRCPRARRAPDCRARPWLRWRVGELRRGRRGSTPRCRPREGSLRAWADRSRARSGRRTAARAPRGPGAGRARRRIAAATRSAPRPRTARTRRRGSRGPRRTA